MRTVVRIFWEHTQPHMISLHLHLHLHLCFFFFKRKSGQEYSITTVLTDGAIIKATFKCLSILLSGMWATSKKFDPSQEDQVVRLNWKNLLILRRRWMSMCGIKSSMSWLLRQPAWEPPVRQKWNLSLSCSLREDNYFFHLSCVCTIIW